jgi:hypothetical protein
MMERPPALVTPGDAEARKSWRGEVAQDEQNSTLDGDGKYGGEGGIEASVAEWEVRGW